MALLLVCLRIVCNAWLNVLQKRALQQLSTSLLVTATFVLLAALTAPFLFFYSFKDLPAAFWCNMLLVVALDIPGNFFLVKSVGLADLSLIGPLNAYKPAVALLLGILFLNETPSLQGWLGVAITLGGSLLLASNPAPALSNRTQTLGQTHGAWYRLLALLCTASASIFLKAAINASSARHTFIAWAILGALLAAILFFGRRAQSRAALRDIRGQGSGLVLMAALFWLMQWFTLQTFAMMPVAYVLALFQLSGLLNVWLGWKIFNEKNILRRAVAGVVMIAGAVLLLVK